MIQIGIETPAENNSFIYAYDAGNNKMVDRNPLSADVNRYAVTASTVCELETLGIPWVVTSLVTEFAWVARLLKAWRPGSPSLTPARLRLMEKQHIALGWSLAMQSETMRIWMGPTELTLTQIDLRDVRQGKAFVIWTDRYWASPFPPGGLQELGISLCAHCAAPSVTGVSLLEQGASGVMYAQCDDSMRPGVVLLKKRLLADSFWRTGEDWPTEPKRGTEAESIWHPASPIERPGTG